MGQLAGHVRGWGGPAPGSLDPVSAPAVGRGFWLEESEGPALPPRSVLWPLLLFPVASSPHHPCSELGLT